MGPVIPIPERIVPLVTRFHDAVRHYAYGMNTTLEPSSAPRPPGPRGLPGLGVSLDMAPSRSLAALERWHRRYGDVFQLPVAGRTMVMACHPDHFEHVLVSHRDNYVKGSAYDGVRRLAGENLVTLDHEAHKPRRRLAQPAFHTRSLRKLGEVMVDATRRWFDQLEARMPDGGRLDVHRAMTDITMEIVVECLFGRGFSSRTQASYDQMTDALGLLSNQANGISLPDWVPTPGNLRFKAVKRALDADVDAVVAAGREAVARGEDDGSLLQMLLRAVDADTGAVLDDDALRDEVLTLFIAGHETTALTMTWFFDLVSPHPGLIERLHDEVRAGLGDEEPTYRSLMGLGLVRRTIDETLRLRPPAPWVGRQLLEPDVLGGFRLEPGDLLMPNLWLLHRHPDFWEEPERFDPDRFLPERSEGRPRFAFLPFSTGPRICIGNMFTYLEAATIAAELVQRCQWTRVGEPAEPRPIATLRPSKAVEIELRWRNDR